MEGTFSSSMLYPSSEIRSFLPHPLSQWEFEIRNSNFSGIVPRETCTATIYNKKLPERLRNPRRMKLPPDPGINYFLKGNSSNTPIKTDLVYNEKSDLTDDGEDGKVENMWDPMEVEAISSLFQGRIPQKPRKLNRARPLPRPQLRRLQPVGLPTPKEHVRTISPLKVSSHKSPEFLIGLAREIKRLPEDEDASSYLNKKTLFLRKGSLSLTIRELDRMGLPERALQTFCWAQKQPQLFPDDRILASAVEVLARVRDLKVSFDLEKLSGLASLTVMEAMARGYIRGGSLDLACQLLKAAKDSNRMLSPGVYAKLLLELGKCPDGEARVLALLNELGERDGLKLSQWDCTAIMKVCLRLGRNDTVESLFSWFKESGRFLTVAMYTAVIQNRCNEERYREAMAVVWEMEGSECLFDLPAYRAVIKLAVVLNDLPRAVRYFSKLKEAGFAPTYDVYRAVIRVYMGHGRLAKCREVYEEAEMAGFKLDKQTVSQLLLREQAS